MAELLTIAATAAACWILLTATAFYARNVLRRIMAQELQKASTLVDEARPLIKDLMTEAGRARALLRHRKAPGHTAPAGDGEEVEVPDALVNIAQAAGLDVGALLQGDPTQVAKLKALASRAGPAQDDQAQHFL